MPETEIKTLVRQSLQLPARCVTALPWGSTLEMGEKRRDDENKGVKKKLNTAGLFGLQTSPAVLKTVNSSSPLRADVVRNSQRSPSFPTENTEVRSIFADFQETQPKTDLPQPLCCLPSQRRASKASSSSLKMLAHEIITANCSSLKWVKFFGLQISKIKSYVEQQDILITDTFCSVHF